MPELLLHRLQQRLPLLCKKSETVFDYVASVADLGLGLDLTCFVLLFLLLKVAAYLPQVLHLLRLRLRNSVGKVV